MSEQTDLNLLRKYCSLCGTDKMFSIDILPLLEIQHYKKGDFICRRDEPLTDLMFLVRGRIKIYVLKQNGVMALSSFAGAPYLIGETEFLLPGTMPNEVEALTDCIFLSLSFVRYGDLLLSDNKFLYSLACLCAKRDAITRQKVSDLVAFPLKNRMASLILRSESDNLYTQKLTEAAEFLNVSYRHLLHVLDLFCREKILRKEKYRCYRILNRCALEDLARPLKDT